MSTYPKPLPAWFGRWEDWRLAGGVPKERPRGLPLLIPKWAWACLAERRQPAPSKPPTLGVFSRPGWVLDNPGMGSERERVQALAAAKFGVIAVNARKGLPAWSTWVSLAHDKQVEVVPWSEIRSVEEAAALQRAKATLGAKAAVFNLERVDLVSPAQLAPYVTAADVVQGLPWFQNGAGWHRVGHAIGSAEAYMNADAKWRPDVCSEHARLEGFGRTVPTLGAGVWSDAPLAVTFNTYRPYLTGPYLVYLLDRVPVGEIAKWAA